MVTKNIFLIDEQRNGILVNKIYKNEYRFPIEMLISGEKFSGVAATLNKEHGKKVLMEFVLRLLSNGPKRYNPFIDRVLVKFTWLDLNDVLEILLLDGIIQITYKNQKPRKTVDWLPKIIQLDPRAEECLIEKKTDYDLELVNLKNQVSDLMTNAMSPLKNDLFRWLEEKQIKDSAGTIIGDWASFKKFKSIMLTVAYYIQLKEQKKQLPLRFISNQIWNQPRVLATYKDEIALAAGITLEELESVLLNNINIDLHAPLISVTPLEELQKSVSKLMNDELTEDIKLDCLNEINHNIQRIIELVPEFPSDSLNNIMFCYNTLKKELIAGSLKEMQVSAFNDLQQSISVIKKELLKDEYIRSNFELIILEQIGRGSFAKVYKVYDPEFNKVAACKVLLPNTYFQQIYGNEGNEYVQRFKREVRLLTKELQHRNIVNVEKVRVEGSPFWFTMPLASFSLTDWMKKNPRVSDEQRFHIFMQILSGVRYLHENDKYHRDLAPNNILLYETDHGLEVKIADFGLAKDPKSVSFFTSLSKRSYGQEDFAAPEQLRSFAQSNHLSDIYSLGALLYYILSNKEPKRRFYASVGCQNIVMKAMDQNPDQRYQRVDELEKEFNRYRINLLK